MSDGDGGAAGGGGGAREPAGGLPEAGAAAYFRAIEDTFVRLRGAPLLLSPADFQVAAGWQRDGVPLPLVVATLEEVFARRAERGAKGKINSLRYCAPAVAAAWAEVRELQGPSHGEVPAEVPVAERLATLATALPPGLEARAEWAARIERLAAAGGGPEAVEEALRALDEEMLATAERGLGPAEREQLEGEVAEIVDGLRDRFRDEELTGLHDRLLRQRLRRHLGLPALTLFG